MSNELATKDESAIVVSQSDGLLAIISKAASDPNVDIDKFERLMAMQEKIQANKARAEFDEALSLMQGEMPVVTRDNEIKHNGKLISTYADWGSINKAIKPSLSKYGFSLKFSTKNTKDEVIMTAILAKGGHRETNTITLPSDTSGAKNVVQAIGSSSTYAQRYAACPLVGVIIDDGDDDGAIAGAVHPISVEQYDKILGMVSKAQRTNDNFTEYLIEQKKLIAGQTIGDLQAKHYEFAIKQLEAAIKRLAAS